MGVNHGVPSLTCLLIWLPSVNVYLNSSGFIYPSSWCGRLLPRMELCVRSPTGVFSSVLASQLNCFHLSIQRAWAVAAQNGTVFAPRLECFHPWVFCWK